MSGRAVSTTAGLLALLGLGALVGLVGAFVQAQRDVALTDVSVPWGVGLVWVVLLCAIRGGVWLVRTRFGGWAVLAGWLGLTVLMALETSSGDLAIAGGNRPMAYLVGGVVLGSAAATIPLPRSAARGT